MAKKAISVRLDEDVIGMADAVDGLSRTDVIEAGIRIVAEYGVDPFRRVVERRLAAGGAVAPPGGVARTEFFQRLKIPMQNGTGKPQVAK